MNEYLTDEELLKLISDIEENDLVQAPPQMAESVFKRIDKKNQILEYRRFRNRVILAVASILVLVTLAPVWEQIVPQSMSQSPWGTENVIENNMDETATDRVDSNRSFVEFANGHYISDILNGSEE